MSPDDELLYRGYTLGATYDPPHWRIAIRPATPQAVATINLPVVEDAERESAMTKARDIVDAIHDGGPGVG